MQSLALHLLMQLRTFKCNYAEIVPVIFTSCCPRFSYLMKYCFEEVRLLNVTVVLNTVPTVVVVSRTRESLDAS